VGRHLIRQLATTIPVLLLVSIIVFLFAHLAPGDPITALAGDQAVDEEVVARLRENYGLDRSLPVQYLTWAGNAITGDLGYSFTTRQDVSDILLDRLSVTVVLTVFALVIAISVAMVMGVLAAIYRGSWIDYANQVLAMIGGSMPAFWFGILLILLISQRLQWLPASGYVSFTNDPVGALRHLTLPAITLSTGYAAVLSRVARASMLDVLHEDYVRTARAKGLSPRRVNISHAFRSALLPIITMVGVEAGHLLGGAVITETVFALPGMGRLLVDSVNSRDFPVFQGATLVLVLLLVASNTIADIAYGLADPRVRRG
jgi:peptide/nickel transport system permease protein